LLLGSLGLALAAGCSNPPHVTPDTITTRSCVNGARSLHFTLYYTAPYISSVEAESNSANVLGTPFVVGVLPGVFEVTADLDSIALGEEVTLGFVATALGVLELSVSDIEFYSVPSDQLPADPDCTAGPSPIFEVALDVVHGVVLDVSNGSLQPMTMQSLELVESPELLSAPMLDWSNPDFNALPWQPALGAGTPLDPLAPPLVIDLPDEAQPTTRAVLCRFVSLSQGNEMRGIVEVDLAGGPLRARTATLGEVKALYRN